MTIIDRARFISDMSSRQIQVKDLTPLLKGMSTTEVDALAGGDHVFNKPEEYGALYDKLVALENAQRAQGVKGDLDRASAVYAKFTASVPPKTPAPSAVDPSSRSRTTGIGTKPPPPPSATILPDKPTLPATASGHIRAFAKAHAEQLRPLAEKNVLGPEAGARKRILNEADRVEARVKALEEKAKSLPPGAERAKIEKEIDREVSAFEGMVASERAGVINGKSSAPSSDPGKDLTNKLPPYLRDSAEKGGFVIPKVPGAVKPSTSPLGLDWSYKF